MTFNFELSLAKQCESSYNTKFVCAVTKFSSGDYFGLEIHFGLRKNKPYLLLEFFRYELILGWYYTDEYEVT